MATRHQETTIHIDDTIKTGNLYLKRGKNGQIMPYYYIDCSLPNLPPRLTRFDRSTGMTDIDLATKKAITMCKEEYKHRLSYGDRSKNISNVKLYENFINFMKKNVAGSVPKLKGGAWTYDDLKKNRGFVENYIAPSIGRKELKNINELDLEDLVATMRDQGKSDKTISNCRTTFHYLWKYAQVRGIVGNIMPKFPPLKPTRYTSTGVKQGFGFITTKQFKEALGKLDKAMKRNDITENQRHKLYMFSMWWKLLADTGMRPMLRTPLKLEEETRNGKWILFPRYEKGIRYVANGTKISIDLVDELNAYYKDMKIKNEELVMVGLDGKLLTQKAYEIGHKQVMEVVGWKDLKDKHGRHINTYSIRHLHITHALQGGEKKIDIAKRCGTSVEMIDSIYYEYSHSERNSLLA